VGLAGRLEATPGIPFEEIRKWLAEGKKFLDELAEHATDKRGVASIQARFASIAATTLIEGGQFDDGLKLASTAADQLHATIGAGSPLHREALELIDLELATARGRQDMGQLNEAVAAATQAVALADAQHDSDSPMLLEQAKSHFQLSQSLAYAKKYEDATKNARECLDDIGRAAEPENVDSKYYKGRCNVVLSYAAWGLHKGNSEYEDYLHVALETFETIPREAESRQMLMAQATAISNLAFNSLASG